MGSTSTISKLAPATSSPDRVLLEGITLAQSRLVQGADPREVFEGLLGDLLELTESEYGFIGEILHDEGTPYLKTHAITNIAWDDDTQAFYEAGVAKGLEFRALDNLFGHVVRTGEPVLTNSPRDDPRHGGIPRGHPPLDAFLGLPFRSRGRLLGMVGIANRPSGYDDALVEFLRPFLLTCSNVLMSIRSERERHETTRSLRESEARGRAILDNAVDAIITIDENFLIESCNPATTKLFGYEASELIGRNVSLLMPAPHRANHDDYVRNYLETGRAKVIGIGREVPAIHKDGSRLTLELAISEIQLDGRRAFVGALRDVSERKRSADELKRLNAELTRRVEELNGLDRDNSLLAELGSFLQASHSEAEMFEAVRTYVSQIFPDGEGGFYALSSDGEAELAAAFSESPLHELEPAFDKTECWALRRGEPHLRCSNRPGLVCTHLAPTDFSSLCVPVMSQDGAVGLLTQAWDMPGASPGVCEAEAERRHRLLSAAADRLGASLSNVRLRMRLQEESVRDPLTRLFNRRYMNGYLRRALRHARRHRTPISLILADIDHFKQLNDTYGHEVGDRALYAVARELSGGLRTDDAACRLGGEEFLLILPGVGCALALERAEGLRARIAELRIAVDGDANTQLTISMGVSSCPEHGSSEEELIRHADKALYRAKESGRNRVSAFESVPP